MLAGIASYIGRTAIRRLITQPFILRLRKEGNGRTKIVLQKVLLLDLTSVHRGVYIQGNDKYILRE